MEYVARINRKVICFLLISAYFIGCAWYKSISDSDSRGYSRRKNYVMNHPELSDRIRQAILKSVTLTGMTREQVKASLRQPYEKKRLKGWGEIVEKWTYKYNTQEMSHLEHHSYSHEHLYCILYFDRDKLKDWRHETRK